MLKSEERFGYMKVISYFCSAKEERDGLSHQRKKLKSGIQPDLSLPRKRRSGLSPSSFLGR